MQTIHDNSLLPKIDDETTSDLFSNTLSNSQKGKLFT